MEDKSNYTSLGRIHNVTREIKKFTGSSFSSFFNEENGAKVPKDETLIAIISNLHYEIRRIKKLNHPRLTNKIETLKEITDLYIDALKSDSPASEVYTFQADYNDHLDMLFETIVDYDYDISQQSVLDDVQIDELRTDLSALIKNFSNSELEDDIKKYCVDLLNDLYNYLHDYQTYGYGNLDNEIERVYGSFMHKYGEAQKKGKENWKESLNEIYLFWTKVCSFAGAVGISAEAIEYIAKPMIENLPK